MKGTAFECLDPALVGPLVLGFSLEDPGAVGRVIKDFAKHERQTGGQSRFRSADSLYGSQGHRTAGIAADPASRRWAMLMGVMLAPVTQFVRTVAEPTAKFVRTVQAVADKQAA